MPESSASPSEGDVSRIALDGRALTRPLTGIGRYAWETLQRMPGSWTALAKPGVPLEPSRALVREVGGAGLDVVWNEQGLALAAREFSGLWGAFGLSPWRRVRPARLVVTVYDTLEREDVGMARGLAATRRAGHAATARRADVVVAISEATAESFRRWYGRRPDLVAEPGPSVAAADPAALERVRARLSDLGGPGTRWALSVGAPIARKNVVRSVMAAAEVPGVRVLLVGGRGDDQTEADLAPWEARGDLVRWGRATQEDLAALYSVADLLLYPPLAEGFGIPLLDARVSGLRIVTAGAEPMRTAAGPDAQLCDALDQSSIAAAIRRSLAAAPPGTYASPGWQRAADVTWHAVTG